MTSPRADLSLQDQIIAAASELLESKQVQCVIGYEKGSRRQARPAFIYESHDAKRLVWNQGCTHNLATYLRDKKTPLHKGEAPPRVAIVVKACDSRALNVLISEKQIERDRVYVIGVMCSGIRQGAGFAGADSDGLQERCLHCAERTPVIYDRLIGEPVSASAIDEPHRNAQLDTLTPAERLDYWLGQFDRCIRCYACRQVCPGCYCNVCLYERDDAQWIGIAPRVKEKGFFHLIRAYHLAGRCIGCDECERVCPMEIPLSSLNRKLAEVVQELFDYRAGREPVSSPLLTMLQEGQESPI